MHQRALRPHERDGILNRYNTEKVAGAFKGSKLISDKFSIPADLVEARFGTAFKVEDGRVVAYDPSGNKIYSRSKPGEVADFDEALETLVDQYPYRDHILKASSGAGSGARQSKGTVSGKQMSRAEFDQLDHATRGTRMKDGWTIKD